jgi:Icc protein
MMKKWTRRTFLKTTALLSTMPILASESKNTPQNSLEFIHITDSHMDLQDETSVEAMQSAVEFINKHYPKIDFVLFGGDNFNNNVKGDKDAKEFQKIISKLKMPSYLVRGNKESHPNPDDSIHLKEFLSMFCDKKALHLSGKDWALEKNGYLILGLDSCIEGQNNGAYTKETIAFAKKKLQEGKPTIILNHHPYLNYWKGTEKKDIHKYVLNNTDEVQKELFGFKNLLLTLSGHKHIDNITQIKGVKAITTRGFVRPIDLDQYPMRYVKLTGDKIEEKLIYTS